MSLPPPPLLSDQQSVFCFTKISIKKISENIYLVKLVSYSNFNIYKDLINIISQNYLEDYNFNHNILLIFLSQNTEHTSLFFYLQLNLPFLNISSQKRQSSDLPYIIQYKTKA